MDTRIGDYLVPVSYTHLDVYKRQGRYYMTYSGNFFAGPDYAVGYATSAHPLGPYAKAAVSYTHLDVYKRQG